MKPTLIQDAIGVLKLTDMHLNNPNAISADTLRAASNECIARLEQVNPEALQLVTLFSLLFALLPAGWLPYVTLTTDAVRPFGTVITDEAGNIACRETGKSVDGLVALVQARLPVGRGEAA